jgi:hypothetical protein
MATNSEFRNVEENYTDNSIQLRRVLSSGIIGLANDIPYNPSESNRSLAAPDYLSFPTTGVSNGLDSKIKGIEDFVAYNPYIHHAPLGALASAGITNVDGGITTINVMNNLVLASIRFELYSRQYRGS